MARSRRKKPIAGIASARSERKAKRWHRKAERARVRVIARRLSCGEDDADERLPAKWDPGAPWGWPKDGKIWYGWHKSPWKTQRWLVAK